MIQPGQDLFGNPCAAGGTVSPGSVRRSAQGNGRGATSAADPFLVLPPLSRYRACSVDPDARLVPPARPLSNTAPAGSFVPVRAMEDVLALRFRQIHDHGHTLDADRALIARTGKRHEIAKLAQASLHFAIEDMMFNKERAQIRRRLVKAAALILAAIDVEDAVDD